MHMTLLQYDTTYPNYFEWNAQSSIDKKSSQFGRLDDVPLIKYLRQVFPSYHQTTRSDLIGRCFQYYSLSQRHSICLNDARIGKFGMKYRNVLYMFILPLQHREYGDSHVIKLLYDQ